MKHRIATALRISTVQGCLGIFVYLTLYLVEKKNPRISQQEKRTIVFCDIPGYYKEAYVITRNFDSDLKNKMRQIKNDKQ